MRRHKTYSRRRNGKQTVVYEIESGDFIGWLVGRNHRVEIHTVLCCIAVLRNPKDILRRKGVSSTA